MANNRQPKPNLPTPPQQQQVQQRPLPTHQQRLFEQEAFNFLNFLHTDDSTPKELQTAWFGFLSKESALTNLDNTDINRIMLYFDDAVLAYAMTRPEYQHTFTEEFVLSQLRPRLLMKLKRSLGGFDRKMIVTSIL